MDREGKILVFTGLIIWGIVCFLIGLTTSFDSDEDARISLDNELKQLQIKKLKGQCDAIQHPKQ